MFPDMSKFIQMREESAKLPHVEVTEEEFIKLMVESGRPLEKAQFDAKMCKGLGSHVRIGDKMVSIKDESIKDESAS